MRELNHSDRARAISLGFNLHPGISQLVSQDTQTTRDTLDPLAAAPGREHHMVPPDHHGNAQETVDPLAPASLRLPGKDRLSTAVRKRLPKGKPHPYAGGSVRSRKLLENVKNIIQCKPGQQRTPDNPFVPLDTVKIGEVPHATEQRTTIPAGPNPEGRATSLGPSSSSSSSDAHNPKRARTTATPDTDTVREEERSRNYGSPPREPTSNLGVMTSSDYCKQPTIQQVSLKMISFLARRIYPPQHDVVQKPYDVWSEMCIAIWDTPVTSALYD